MSPDAAAYALIIIEQSTLTPRDPDRRAEVLRAFDVLHKATRQWAADESRPEV